MSDTLPIYFGPFRIDPLTTELHRGDDLVSLKPRAAELLLYMVRNPGRVLSKEELLGEVWRGTHVTPGVLKVHVHQIRRALGDGDSTGGYVETVGRTGYRFVAEGEDETSPSGAPIGRESELAELERALGRAAQGVRTLVLVEGEPGIGKTTLVDAFTSSFAQGADEVWVARGQCIQHYGEGEAYLPFFGAIEGLAASGYASRRAQVLETLERAAPSWLLQLPSLVGDEARLALRDRVEGASPDRMPREMATALAELAGVAPLVLVLEDLHWSDVPTIDLLSYLVQARDPARVLVIGTYRPADVVVSGHPVRALRQELVAKRLCHPIAVEPLTEGAIETYLAGRFPRSSVAAELAPKLHQWTDGNPLFMTTLVDDLVARSKIVSADDGWAVARDGHTLEIPSSLRDFIQKQVEANEDPVRPMLDVAGVSGSPFASALVAAVLGRPVEEVEESFDELVHGGHILVDAGVWENAEEGAPGGRYAFRHALFPAVVCECIPPSRRRRLHAQIGRWLEASYGDRASEHGAELARHFESAQVWSDAARYYRGAAETAVRRSANALAVGLAERGLSCLRNVAEDEGRHAGELALELARGGALATTRGIADPEVEAAYSRAQTLSRRIGDSAMLLPSLIGLGYFRLARLELAATGEIAGEMVVALEGAPDSELAPFATFFLTELALARGEREELVRWLEATKRKLSDRPRRFDATSTWLDPRVSSAVYEASLVWADGSPARATEIVDRAVADARELGHAYSLTYALALGSVLAVELRDERRALSWAEEAVERSGEGGFDFLRARAEIPAGWAQARTGSPDVGVARIRGGLDAMSRVGVRFSTGQSMTALADALLGSGDARAAEEAARDGVRLCEETGERISYPEALRLVGSSLWARASRNSRATRLREEAEQGLRVALEAAHVRQIRCVALRAATDLALLLSTSDRTPEAIELLGAELVGLEGERGNPDVDAGWTLLERFRA